MLDVFGIDVLGQFKLEDRIMKGYFLAPKSYYYITKDGTDVLKFKGPAKNMVQPEWFESQYADPSRTQQVPVEANFRIDWHTLNIRKKDTLVRLGIKPETKRIPVYQRDVWVDTNPISIKDLPGIDYIGKRIIKLQKTLNLNLQTINQSLMEKLSLMEKEKEEKFIIDAKNTEKSQLTSDHETSQSVDRTLLDKEELREVTTPTFECDEKIPNSDEKDSTRKTEQMKKVVKDQDDHDPPKRK